MKPLETSLEPVSEGSTYINSTSVKRSYSSSGNLVTCPPSKIAAALYISEYNINNVPLTVRNLLTKTVTQEEICIWSGAKVSTKGCYVPPEAQDKFTSVKPLHLFLQAPKAENVERAIQRINSLIEQAMNLPKYKEKVLIGLETAPASFDVRGKVLGPSGVNLQYITNESGAIVTLRGRRSGYVEPTTGQESIEPLHLCVEHNKYDVLQAGRQLAFNLIETVQQEWYNFQQQSSSAPTSTSHSTTVSQVGNSENYSSGAVVSLAPPIVSPPPILSVPPPTLPPSATSQSGPPHTLQVADMTSSNVTQLVQGPPPPLHQLPSGVVPQQVVVPPPVQQTTVSQPPAPQNDQQLTTVYAAGGTTGNQVMASTHNILTQQVLPQTSIIAQLPHILAQTSYPVQYVHQGNQMVVYPRGNEGVMLVQYQPPQPRPQMVQIVNPQTGQVQHLVQAPLLLPQPQVIAPPLHFQPPALHIQSVMGARSGAVTPGVVTSQAVQVAKAPTQGQKRRLYSDSQSQPGQQMPSNGSESPLPSSPLAIKKGVGEDGSSGKDTPQSSSPPSCMSSGKVLLTQEPDDSSPKRQIFIKTEIKPDSGKRGRLGPIEMDMGREMKERVAYLGGGKPYSQVVQQQVVMAPQQQLVMAGQQGFLPVGHQQQVVQSQLVSSQQQQLQVLGHQQQQQPVMPSQAAVMQQAQAVIQQQPPPTQAALLQQQQQTPQQQTVMQHQAQAVMQQQPPPQSVMGQQAQQTSQQQTMMPTAQQQQQAVMQQQVMAQQQVVMAPPPLHVQQFSAPPPSHYPHYYQPPNYPPYTSWGVAPPT